MSNEKHGIPEFPRVGVAVLITRDGKFIAGRRKGSHAGQLGLPGGKIDYKEHPEDCCRREIFEETGLVICRIKLLHAESSIFGISEYPFDHWVTLFYSAELVDPAQEPELKEPNKCEGWRWFDLDAELPPPVFKPLDRAIAKLKDVPRLLSGRDSRAFLDMLESDVAPTQALADAAKRYKGRTENGKAQS